ncbi:MAG: hypothetical protein ACD_44C00348G0010 [uncultured bacterium]|nr:MAG: hypothetical protein ACD_44C00348G0010 [uncultured bacterium]
MRFNYKYKKIFLLLRKLALFYVGYGFFLIAFADKTPVSAVTTNNYFLRADYFSLRVPDDQPRLSLVGLHLAKQFSSGFYLGSGLYSAVAGQYSGFFALGGEAGWQHLIWRQLGFDTGLFVGTGGGSNTASFIGDGGFVLPHAGFFYRFPYFDLGLNYSGIRFQGGQVSSQQVQFALTCPFQLYTKNKTRIFSEKIPFACSKNYIAAVASIYYPQHSQFSNGQALVNNTELLGIELGHFFTDHIYNYFEFTGAIHGNQNGYANFFAGVGWQQLLGNNHFFYSPRLALGSGGGGGYDVGGGLLIYPTLGLGWQFVPHWQLEILPGYVSSFTGHYQAWTTELQLKYDFNIAVPSNKQMNAIEDFSYQAWRLRFGNQLYIHPQHENSLSNSNINLLALKIDRFFETNWYLSGQTAFAYSGNAAGYFSGMLGGGYQTKDYYHLSLFAEGLMGTGGGASLAIQDGALSQLGMGLNYHVNPSLGFYSEISEVLAFKGGFNTVTIDLGLSYSFDLLTS